MKILISQMTALVLGLLLDAILGDPHGWWHPVIGMGTLITKTEQLVRKRCPKTKQGERVAGVILVLVVVVLSVLIPMVLLVAAYQTHIVLGILIEAVMCDTMLAAKSLKTESMKVWKALEEEDLAAGRRAVSMIVGRDTQNLDETGVISATVETVAENTSDGVIAPLLYMGLFGALGGFFYKAINTMDSMVGYKNETYRYFGTPAAKLDDVVNFIPARISGVVMILAAFLCGMDGKGAARIFKRDRLNHASPNSAETEAVMAGALGVQLAGDAWYFGVKHEKPTIGDARRKVERQDIARSNRLMYRTTFITVIGILSIKIIVLIFLQR
ncbi:MAG: adenosylcobinamide-phosphate synthase CbiB [Lachnospiraceae bacterium]